MRYLANRKVRPSGLRWEDRHSSHTALEGRSRLGMSGRALRIRRRRRIAECTSPKDRQIVGLEAAGGGASLVYSFAID